MQKNGAQIIIELLEQHGVRTVFGIPGGANLPLYDALAGSSITHVLARHEQGAAFMAQGMARVTGQAAVCLATSGPGATNLLTAIADAKADSVPIIAITGQVHSALLGRDAFQEVDTYGLCLPIAKQVFMAQSLPDLTRMITEAFRIATSGRPGPVVIDIPRDIQTALAQNPTEQQTLPLRPSPIAPVGEALLEEIATRINHARCPVILAGGGVIAAQASALLHALSQRAAIPVATTLMGLGCIPAGSALSLGFIGMHGARAANHAIEAADLLIAVGMRFGDRATGRVEEFCGKAGIIHIDIDGGEIGKIKEPLLAARADIAQTLRGLLPRISENKRTVWRQRLNALRRTYEARPPENADLRHPACLIHAIANLAGPQAIITTDVGQHQMWTAQYYPFSRPRSFLTSGGLGAMGFGLPAAIGAALAQPQRLVVCISGDGSIYMNIQELATLADLGSNVKIVVLNNQYLGLVRQQQQLFFGGRYFASRLNHHAGLAALARAFGIAGVDLGQAADAGTVLRETFDRPGPVLIDAPIHEQTNVYPMVPPGAANTHMIGDDYDAR